jgi:hypothetical protein
MRRIDARRIILERRTAGRYASEITDDLRNYCDLICYDPPTHRRVPALLHSVKYLASADGLKSVAERVRQVGREATSVPPQ